jgi:outer membrane cobalamin receptor
MLKTGAVTDSKGKFEITALSFGKYFVLINFIGFKSDTIRDVTMRPNNTEVDLGEIAIRLEEVNLNEVTVTGEKEVLEYNLDKKVINVGKDITATGGTALDVMKNVPSVSVDMDGNMSLRGSSLNILVDGKPSTMDPTLLLEQLPADMIDKIEIVTNPSARYDAEGMGGIINIVTKKNKMQGLNGIFNATYGSWDKVTGTVNLNYRNKKVNYFLSVDGRYTPRSSSSENDKAYFNGDTVQYSNQNSDGTRKGPNYSVKAGTDLSLTDRDFSHTHWQLALWESKP